MRTLIITIFIALLTLQIVSAQVGSLYTFGGVLSDHANGVAADPEGNIYVTGSFQGDVTFGTHKLKSAGDTDIFLQKIDKSGKTLWVMKAGSKQFTQRTITEAGVGVLLLNNSIYIVGNFTDKAWFGNEAVTSRGFEDIFIAKYSTDGELIWVKSAGGNAQDLATAIATDGSSIYITGHAQRSYFFDNTQLSCNSGSALFVAKYSTEGDLVWAKQKTVPFATAGKAIKCSQNQCIIAGEVTSVSQVYPIIYIVDRSGNEVSTRELPEVGNFIVRDLDLQGNHCVVAGAIVEASTEHTSSILNYDAAVMKVKLDGQLEWVSQFGGDRMDIASSVSLSNHGGIVVGGGFQDVLVYRGNTLQSSGADDIFVATFTSNGDLLSIESHGGKEQDRLTDILIQDNRIYFTGFYRSSTSFKGLSSSAVGQSDVFIYSAPYALEKSENEISNPLKLYPNPAKDKLIIETPSTVKGIDVINGSGIKIFSNRKECDSPCTLRIDRFSPGVYLLKVQIGNMSRYTKFVVVD